MASGTRSSKRKSSPSLKKKRRINKDRSKKRNKLGRGKSKEVTRRESPDSHSDDESLSAASSMSYSSTDSDRRRSRSRTRKDTSKRRKKSRGRRLRSESSEDDTRHERRSKRSKKKRQRKKRRREQSVSSSRRSVSCSTCEATDDSEREQVSTVKRRGKRRRDLDGGDGSYLNEEQVQGESNPRRLRSIIIFAKECEEPDKELLDRDGHKEEIIYDHDDYPSPRSNESNDGDAKKEQLEEPKTNVSSTDAGSNNTDLEAVLRQKALENLRKFKGGLRADAKKLVSTKSSIDDEVKQSSSLIDDVEGQKKDQDGSAGVVGAESLQTLPQDSKMVNPSEEGKSDDADRLEALPTQELPVLDIPATESLPLPSKDANEITDSVDGVNDKHKTGASNVRQRLGLNKLKRQLAPIPESSMLVSEPEQNKDIIETGQSSHDTKIVTDVIDKTSNAQENKEGDSQFQKKTMSVMRGGEMVQVNYKVYIPKNAPALARRKLRR